MIKYEVLYWYNPETQERDIRCRSDIDKQLGFSRLLNGLVMHTSFKSGNKRLFTVAFVGSERDAKWYAETLKRTLDGLGVTRSYITTDQE
jgi:hypothetical protein